MLLTLLPIRPASACALALSGLFGCSAAQAYLVGIGVGTRALYLQVGTGTFTGTYQGGGTPGDNTTINTVTATVGASAIGSGAQTMSTNSTVSNSPYDNFAFCTPGTGQVYVGGFYRLPSLTGASATLSVTTPLNLVNASSDTIPFSTISWVSGGAQDASATIPSGTFAGGSTQTLLSVALNNWFESCLTFSYANAQLAPAGTFTGRATYQLVAP
ncbi:hypothetical protein QTH89_19530 [Variovorax sp. J22G21]|uniref:hypothetical protein n=1 Tax=Variovorax fucosicus TaxID=3053517 RepID=UPI002575373C|nr:MULTISPECIES: hypothetical protein [unclassified Variovorax]MDM0038633.1 hypothetical protein [Variovorax sp. J22R193]MDM0063409.1 hypothetical protein [Variovorax sp. J22G21]